MLLSIVFVLASVLILWKCADWFVEGAVGVAERLHVPHMLVGLVLVSLATTSPELMSSLIAAMQGKPEMALGNAVGSVVVDASLALGLAAMISSTPLVADPAIFRSSAMVLLLVIGLAFWMTLDTQLTALEGMTLLAIFVVYTIIQYISVRRRQREEKAAALAEPEELKEIEAHLATMTIGRIVTLFVVGFLGVLFGSHLLVTGADGIAQALNLSGIVIGIVLVAVGTSTPEIATCVVSAMKGKSGIGVGNIIGADILNICWVAGLSSLANPLTAKKSEILFMFPGVFIIVSAMLLMLWFGNYRLVRWNGVVLVALYVVYTILLFVLVAPQAAPAH